MSPSSRPSSGDHERTNRHRVQGFVQQDGQKRSETEHRELLVVTRIHQYRRAQRQPVYQRVQGKSERDSNPTQFVRVMVVAGFGVRRFRVSFVVIMIVLCRRVVLVKVKGANEEEHAQQADHHPNDSLIEVT